MGHRESDIWDYPYGKFKLYLEAAVRRSKRASAEQFELTLVASRGTEESIKEFRESLKGR